MAGAQWQFDGMDALLTDQLKEEICGAGVVLSGKEDRLIWQSNSSGVFTVKSAWQQLRGQQEKNDIASLIWDMKTAPSA